MKQKKIVVTILIDNEDFVNHERDELSKIFDKLAKQIEYAMLSTVQGTELRIYDSNGNPTGTYTVK